jgi:membrane fusion protein, multidrug efflux system
MSNAAYVTEQQAKINLTPSRQAIKRAALALAVSLGIAGIADLGYDYFTSWQYQETTDDAYVQADSTIIAPKVSGYIAEVLVQDNEKVSAGQILARIDDRDFRAALNQARADVAAAEAAVKNLNAQIELQTPLIQQQASQVEAAEANLKFAQEEQSGLLAANKKIEVLTTQRDQAAAQLDHARAVEQQAELNLSYTEITAPVDGTVGARTLRVGQYVQAGTQLMAVVPLDAVYLVANFKETQLTNVRNGQPVEIRVDSFHSIKLKGHVDSLSPASGLQFALLPPDNATGNFTKIVQRVPVKIVFDNHNLKGLLRPGMSAEPTVDTKATVMTERDAEKQIASRGPSPRG